MPDGSRGRVVPVVCSATYGHAGHVPSRHRGSTSASTGSPQGINVHAETDVRTSQETDGRLCVSSVIRVLTGLRLRPFVTLAVAWSFFERMTDGGVALYRMHIGCGLFISLLADMDSDTARCLSDNRAEPPAYTESPQAQVPHSPPAHGEKKGVRFLKIAVFHHKLSML
jgi:hypothetical protein